MKRSVVLTALLVFVASPAGVLAEQGSIELDDATPHQLAMIRAGEVLAEVAAMVGDDRLGPAGWDDRQRIFTVRVVDLTETERAAIERMPFVEGFTLRAEPTEFSMTDLHDLRDRVAAVVAPRRLGTPGGWAVGVEEQRIFVLVPAGGSSPSLDEVESLIEVVRQDFARERGIDAAPVVRVVGGEVNPIAGLASRSTGWAVLGALVFAAAALAVLVVRATRTGAAWRSLDGSG